MTRRKVCKLHPPGGEIGVAADENGVGPLARDRFNAALISRPVVALKIWICGPMARAAASTSANDRPGLRGICRIDEHADTNRSGHKLPQKPKLLCPQLTSEKIDPCQVAARPSEADDKTKPDRVFGNVEDDGDRRGCQPLPPVPKDRLQARQSRRLGGEPTRQPTPAADLVDSRPSDIRSPHSRPRHSRRPSSPGESAQTIREPHQATPGGEPRSPASPAAARAHERPSPPCRRPA